MLFEVVDKTGDAMTCAEEFESGSQSCLDVLFRDTLPTPVLSSACRDCPVFADKRLGGGLAHTVLEIPALHYKKLQRLSREGVVARAAARLFPGLGFRGVCRQPENPKAYTLACDSLPCDS